MSEFDTHEDIPRGGPDSPAEIDDADAFEQYRDIVDESNADATDMPDGVDPADAYEQRLVVEDDDDGYDDR